MLTRRALFHGGLRGHQQPTRSTSVGLEPYAGPWTEAQARHLLRRTGCGAPLSEVTTFRDFDGAPEAVTAVLETSTAFPAPVRPQWYLDRRTTSGTGGQYDVNRSSDFDETSPLRHKWFERMRKGRLAGKMVLFWHNFFPVERARPSIWSYHLFDYYYLLVEHAFGNFKALVYDIGLTPAMLVYLDGRDNRAGNPNENYARELLERFTMGVTGPDGEPNYTETDVHEIARALTGITFDNNVYEVYLDSSRHDGGVKYILGQQGLFQYDQVIDILFEERAQAIAHFVCRKLYCFFVRPLPDEDMVAAMAETLLAYDFDILPVLEALFSSAHFYVPAHQGSRIKSPLELLVAVAQETGTDDIPAWLYGRMYREQLDRSGANLLGPPNVGGWPGYNPPETPGVPGQQTWVNSITLERHQKWVHRLIPHFWEKFWNLERATALCSDPDDPFCMALSIADYLMPGSLELFDAGAEDVVLTHDPSIPLPEWVLEGPAYVKTLGAVLLNGLPYYNWPKVSEGNPQQLRDAEVMTRRFVVYLTQHPDYHLT